MKILFKYLQPYRWLVALTLFLAAINMGFSLVDPILLGKLINLANDHRANNHSFSRDRFFNSFSWDQPGVWFLLFCSITVAMISRIAKNFQDYCLNVVTAILTTSKFLIISKLLWAIIPFAFLVMATFFIIKLAM